MRTANSLKLSLLMAGVLVSGGVAAQSKTWTFNDTAAPATCSGSNVVGTVIACQTQPSGTTTTLEVSAWSSASSSSSYAAASVTPQGGNGFGVGNVSEGGNQAQTANADHSVDNANGNGIDALLLKFTTGAEALTHVGVGWSGTDGDFQVLRWTGASTPASNFLTGKNSGNIISSGGWELVALVNGAGGINTPDATFSNFNNNKLTSSYWLLSAYNSGITSTATGTNSGTATSGVDALKFIGIGTTNTSTRVPEPASLALAAIAMVGLWGTRRRKQA